MTAGRIGDVAVYGQESNSTTRRLPGLLRSTMAICSPIRRTGHDRVTAHPGDLAFEGFSRCDRRVERPWTGTVSACWSMVTVATATWGRQWIASFSLMVEIW